MKSSTTHLPSLLGSLLFTMGAMVILGVSLLLGVVMLANLLTGKPLQLRETVLLAVTLFEGALLVGAAYFSLQKLLQLPAADSESSFTITAWQVAACLAIAGAALLLGRQIIDSEPFNWLLIPLLTLPAVLFPIVILFGLGARGISLGPRWRTWNVLGISMTLVPFLTFVLEILLMAFLFVLGGLFISSQPRLVAQIERLSGQIYLLERDPQAVLDLLAPLVLRPEGFLVALSYFALLVPMLEELIKPLGVWLFSGQIRSPAQGFALGALSGSAYALIETLGVSPQTTDWTTLLLTRLGTDILHVTTSALMGAGIVYAIHERRYLRLMGIYLLSVFLHGLWNGLAILFTFSSLADQYAQDLLNGLATPAAAAVAVLAGLLLLLLILANRRVRTTQPQSVTEDRVT